MKYLSLLILSLLIISCSDNEKQTSTDFYIGAYTLENHECYPFSLVPVLSQELSVEKMPQSATGEYKVLGFLSEELILNKNLEYDSPILNYTSFSLKLTTDQIVIKTEILNINSYESCEYIYVK